MLTIPWFVVKTVKDLCRLTPQPLEIPHQQQEQEQVDNHKQLLQEKQPALQQQQPRNQQVPVPQEQQKPVQQEQLQQKSVQQQQNSTPQQKNTAPQSQEQQKAVQLQQQKSSPQPQNSAAQLQPKIPVSQLQQKPTQPQLQKPLQQQNTSPQQQNPLQHQNTSPQPQKPQQLKLTPQMQPQQQNPAQQQQIPEQQQQNTTQKQQNLVQQQQKPTSQQKQPLTQDTVSQSNLVRVQNSPSTTTPVSALSTETIQATTATTQHANPASTRQVEKSSKVSDGGDKMSFEWAQQQVQKFQFDFEQADKDKSGSLSLQEVYDVLLNVGFKGTKEEAKSIFGHLDRDRDQKVTKEEFTATLKNLPRLSIKEFVLRKTFLKLDKDGSGYLSRSEIEDATKSEKGLDISAEKIADLLIYLVKEDKDQKVSYEEFLHVFGVESAATVMKQVFSKLDSDGSGYLTKEEILAAVNSEFELKLKADKISDLLIYWCKDQDKKINYQEFVDVWLQEKRKPTK